MITNEDFLAVVGGWKRDPATGQWALPAGWRRDVLGRLVPPPLKQLLLGALLQIGGVAAGFRMLNAISKPGRRK